jgi:zinc transporter ZupT
MIGTGVGSMVGQVYLKECLALTSGGFLYFSINGFMTELKKVDTFSELINCFISSMFGMYIMYLIALFE